MELKKSSEFSTLTLNRVQIQTLINEENLHSHEILRDHRVIAGALLQYLEENYPTKKWMVIVLPIPSGQQTNIHYSKGFYVARSKDTFAAAISVDGTDLPDFTDDANSLLRDFRLPLETITKIDQMEFGLRAKDGAQNYHQHFDRFLIPLWTNGRLGVESMSITTPCITSEKKTEDYVAILTSKGFKWKRITNHDECDNKQLIVVPNLEEIASQKPSTQCNKTLLNEFAQSYLSVEGDSKEEGSYVTLDRFWRNATGQRWKFVNNQLVNNGKCLTAWTERSWYLYQYDCHPDWAGQIWIRHGLQIVNGFRFCLAVREEGSAVRVVQDLCDSTPPFIWYNLDASC